MRNYMGSCLIVNLYTKDVDCRHFYLNCNPFYLGLISVFVTSDPKLIGR